MRGDSLGRALAFRQDHAARQRDVRGVEEAGPGAHDDIGGRIFRDEEQRGRHDIDRVERLERFGRENILSHARARDRRERVDLDVVLGAFEIERLGKACEAELGREDAVIRMRP